MNFGVRKIILLIVCINVMLYIGGFELVNIGGSNMINHWVSTDEGGNIQNLSSNVEDYSPRTSKGFISGAISSIVNYFVDPIMMVSNFLNFIINITFSPIALFLNVPNMPITVSYMIGLPLLVLYLLGLIWFARSGGD